MVDPLLEIKFRTDRCLALLSACRSRASSSSETYPRLSAWIRSVMGVSERVPVSQRDTSDPYLCEPTMNKQNICSHGAEILSFGMQVSQSDSKRGCIGDRERFRIESTAASPFALLIVAVADTAAVGPRSRLSVDVFDESM